MKTIATLFTVSLMLTLAGCNTVRGIGEDVQKAGTVIEDAAKKK